MNLYQFHKEIKVGKKFKWCNHYRNYVIIEIDNNEVRSTLEGSEIMWQMMDISLFLDSVNDGSIKFLE